MAQRRLSLSSPRGPASNLNRHVNEQAKQLEHLQLHTHLLVQLLHAVIEAIPSSTRCHGGCITNLTQWSKTDSCLLAFVYMLACRASLLLCCVQWTKRCCVETCKLPKLFTKHKTHRTHFPNKAAACCDVVANLEAFEGEQWLCVPPTKETSMASLIAIAGSGASVRQPAAAAVAKVEATPPSSPSSQDSAPTPPSSPAKRKPKHKPQPKRAQPKPRTRKRRRKASNDDSEPDSGDDAGYSQRLEKVSAAVCVL